MELTSGKLLRIYVDEHDLAGTKPRYVALVQALRDAGIAGATVLRGIEGFGSHGVIHTSKLFHGGPMPLVVEAIDTPSKIDAVVDTLAALTGESPIIMQDVVFARFGT